MRMRFDDTWQKKYGGPGFKPIVAMSESVHFRLFFLRIFEANNGTHRRAAPVPKLVGS